MGGSPGTVAQTFFPGVCGAFRCVLSSDPNRDFTAEVTRE